MKWIFWLLPGLIACDKYDTSPAPIGEDLTLTVRDTANVRSDARSIVTLTLQNTKETKNGLTVQFQTTKGSILVNDVPFQNNQAAAQLRVDQDTGTYFVKAFLKEGEKVHAEKRVSFSLRRAYPDSIALEVDRSLYSLTAPLTIRTYLFRANGLVTKGTPVFYRAFQMGNTPSDTIPVGRFEGIYNNYSNAEGKLADIKLFTDSPGIDTLKSIFIHAEAFRDNGNILRKVVVMRYK